MKAIMFVVVYCVRMLHNLIMREMIRVKGRVSELALSIVNLNPNIRNSAKVFFVELSQKATFCIM